MVPVPVNRRHAERGRICDCASLQRGAPPACHAQRSHRLPESAGRPHIRGEMSSRGAKERDDYIVVHLDLALSFQDHDGLGRVSPFP